MVETTHLGLKLVNAAEWNTTYFRDYIEAMSANDGASNMAKIDEAVAALQEAVENIPSPITGVTEQVMAVEAIGKGNVARLEDTGAYLATTATSSASYRLGIADEDIAAGEMGSVTMVARIDSHADTIIEQNQQKEQKVWSGTHAEYSAIEEPDEDTVYFVTEDDSEGDTVVTAEDLASAVAASEARTNAQMEALFQSVDDGKELVASAITDKGVATIKDATFAEMAANIGEIATGVDTSDATMTDADLRVGKIGYGASGKITGSLADVDSGAPEISFNWLSGKVTASVHQDSGYIPTATDQSATYQITAKGAQTYTPGTAAQTILANQYLTGNQTIQGDANLTAENIVSGVSIFGVTGTASTGSSSDGKVATVTVTNNSSSGKFLVFGSLGRQTCAAGETGTAEVAHVGELIIVVFYGGSLTMNGVSVVGTVYKVGSASTYTYRVDEAAFSVTMN